MAAIDSSNKGPAPAPDAAHMLLIRHGATAWNEARPARLQGSGMDLDLSPAGIRQARALGATLRRFRLAKIYCSHLKRAQQTAQAIADAQEGGGASPRQLAGNPRRPLGGA